MAFLKDFATRLDSNADEDNNLLSRVTALREQMGVMQHHDAVTGTEKQHVANDYILKTYEALQGCNENLRMIFNELTQPTQDHINPSTPNMPEDPPALQHFEFDSCHLLNISQCEISQSGHKFMVTVYNPLAHATFQPVRIPVPHSNYRVRDYREVPVQIQIVPITDRVEEMSFRNSSALYEIVFLAQEIPGLGYKSYFVEPLENAEQKETSRGKSENAISWRDATPEFIEIGNEHLKAIFDVKSGHLSQVGIDGKFHKMKQEFFYYKGYDTTYNSGWARASGAYILRPNGGENHFPGNIPLKLVRGEVVDEVYQQVNEWVSQVVRIYHDNSSAIEFEWTVGPIPVQDSIGKEVVSRFTGEIASKGVFYTDSNGREMIKRTRNERALYKDELVPINYYPLNSRVYLQDERNRMAILTDRAQGTTSLSDGSIDVMLHRRLLYDDGFGVGEALNEVQYNKGLIATGKLHLLFNSLEDVKTISPSAAAAERFLEKQILLPNWVFFSKLADDSYESWLKKYKNIVSGIIEFVSGREFN